MLIRILRVMVASFAVNLPFTVPAAALPSAPGYLVDTIDAGDVTTGGVAVEGGTVFVGVGGFGAQSVVRIDPDGTVTTLATGFSSLSGVEYDAINDRLLVGDNGLELSGVTGDTLYGIPTPFATPGVVPVAASLELAPSGSIDGVADVILDPTDPTGMSLLVSDSEFPALPAPQGGQLWSLDAGIGSVSVLQQGLGFSAGLAASSTTLFLGEADLVTFEGVVSTLLLSNLGGAPSVLSSGLPGQFDLALASDGTLLSTSLDQILGIDPVTGDVTGIASGFGFATGIDEEDGILYALDFGSNTVFRFTPIPEPGTLTAVAAMLAAVSVWRRRSRGVRR